MQEEKPANPNSSELPQEEISQEEGVDKKPRKKLNYLYVFVGFVILISLVGSFSKIKQRTPSNEEVFEEIQYMNEEADTVTTTAKKIIFSKENNIFAYSLDNGQIYELTNFPINESYSPAYDESGVQKPNISIDEIRVLDESTLSFAKCGIVKGDFGCGIYLLSTDSKDIVEKEKLNADMNFLAFDSYNNDTFAYLVTASDRWQLYLQSKGSLKMLEDLSTDGYGRGGFIEDSEKIRFSADGDYFLQISTSSPRNIEDFNIYVYEVETGSLKEVISEATQPTWLDNNRIIYRKYKKESGGDGLHIYDLNNNKDEKIEEVSDDASHPEALLNENRVLYEVYNKKQVFLYNLIEEESTIISEKAVSPFWVTTNSLVYDKVELKTEGTYGGIDHYVTDTVIYNISDNSKKSVGDIIFKQETQRATTFH